MDQRKEFEIIMANMYSNSEYSNYIYYAHLIAQCAVKFDDNLPSYAGVSFNIDHYTLWINSTLFKTLSNTHKAGLLKHEMLHISFDHVSRKNDRDHKMWNYATDIAINQMIQKDHLPKGGLLHSDPKFNFPANLTSEQYYELLKQDREENEKNNTPENAKCPKEQCESDGENGEGTGIDNHGKWYESEGDEELRKDITKTMMEKSFEKSRGNAPSNYNDMLSLFLRPAQVSWKRVLKNIVGNKKANSRRTIMRVDRRFPGREDLKGKTKDRTFDLAVIVDVSGSMSDNEIMTGLTEIHEICKMTNSTLKMVQVDTVVRGIEEFKKTTKLFKRKANGGTYIYPAIEYLREKKVNFDALVVITDGGIEDVSHWEKAIKQRCIFLTTQANIPGIENTKYKQFNLKSQR